MNALKNMEAIFVVAAVLFSVAAGSATAAAAATPAVHKAALVASADSHMNVVTVHAKRLTAFEKAALI
jgi:hypothetical protein